VEILKIKFLPVAAFVVASLPLAAHAQGTVRGAEEGAAAGERAAGRLGAIVGGTVGAAAGTVGGILGVEERPQFREYVIRKFGQWQRNAKTLEGRSATRSGRITACSCRRRLGEILGRSPWTIWDAVKRGQIPTVTVGRRRYIPRGVLADIISGQTAS
jgi:hypothetical protein